MMEIYLLAFGQPKTKVIFKSIAKKKKEDKTNLDEMKVITMQTFVGCTMFF